MMAIACLLSLLIKKATPDMGVATSYHFIMTHIREVFRRPRHLKMHRNLAHSQNNRHQRRRSP